MGDTFSSEFKFLYLRALPRAFRVFQRFYLRGLHSAAALGTPRVVLPSKIITALRAYHMAALRELLPQRAAQASTKQPVKNSERGEIRHE